jgi:hypothetical protein
VLTFEYQKLTKRNENKPMPSQETKKKVKLVVFMSRNIKKRKKPIKLENL